MTLCGPTRSPVPPRAIDDDDFGHPAEEVREAAEDAEPNGLVGGLARLDVGVREQREREVVRVLPGFDALDRLRDDGDDFGVALVEVADAPGELLDLLPAVRAVVVALEEQDGELDVRREGGERALEAIEDLEAAVEAGDVSYVSLVATAED